MKPQSILRFFILLIIPCFTGAMFGQSLSGHVNSNSDKKKLGYATVNIYQNGKLLHNLLTDAEGNFKIKLDTGLYRCEISYAGRKTVTKNIHVKGDEKNSYGLDEDKSSEFVNYMGVEKELAAPASMAEPEYSGAPPRLEEIEVKSAKIAARGGRSESSSYAKKAMALERYDAVGAGAGDASGPGTYNWKNAGVAMRYGYFWGVPSDTSTAKAGRLTAGEINDFSKWNLWTDLAANELKGYKEFWDFSPEGRYVVQLKNNQHLPIAGAKVELMNGDKVLFTAISDNTGKAELWANTKYSAVKGGAVSVKISHAGKSETIRNVRSFENGINTQVMNTPCEQPQDVDIAMVVDATGSMQDEIDYLKQDLNSVIYNAKKISTKLNMQFANVFYRDTADSYVTDKQNFTNVLSNAIAFINKHNADGGGDTEEAVELALDSAINKLSWRSTARTKILFLVLDAPPHNTDKIRTKMLNLASKAAQKGIRIVPVAGSGYTKSTEYLMRCMALATNGTFVFLTNHSGIGDSHINPSTDNYQVELLNDLLVRIIKAFTYMPDCKQEVADLGLNLPDSVVNVSDFVDSASVSNATRKLKWRFFPNPSRGIIHIVADQEIKDLLISDLSGKLLHLIGNIEAHKEVEVNLSHLSAGIYLIRFPIGKQWISGKILLQPQ